MKRFVIVLILFAAAFAGLNKRYHFFQGTATELVIKPDASYLATMDSGQTVQMCPFVRMKKDGKFKIAVPYDTLLACKSQYMLLPDSERYEVMHADKFPSIDVGPIYWKIVPDSLGRDNIKATMDKPRKSVAT